MPGSIVNFSSWLQRLGFTETEQPETVRVAQPVRLVADDRPHVGPVIGPSGFFGITAITGSQLPPSAAEDILVDILCPAPGGTWIQFATGGLNNVGPIVFFLDNQANPAWTLGPFDLEVQAYNGPQSGAAFNPDQHQIRPIAGRVANVGAAAVTFAPSIDPLRSPITMMPLYVPPGQFLRVLNGSAQASAVNFVATFTELPATELIYGPRDNRTAF